MLKNQINPGSNFCVANDFFPKRSPHEVFLGLHSLASLQPLTWWLTKQYRCLNCKRGYPRCESGVLMMKILLLIISAGSGRLTERKYHLEDHTGILASRSLMVELRRTSLPCVRKCTTTRTSPETEKTKPSASSSRLREVWVTSRVLPLTLTSSRLVFCLFKPQMYEIKVLGSCIIYSLTLALSLLCSSAPHHAQ